MVGFCFILRNVSLNLLLCLCVFSFFQKESKDKQKKDKMLCVNIKNISIFGVYIGKILGLLNKKSESIISSVYLRKKMQDLF